MTKSKASNSNNGDINKKIKDNTKRNCLFMGADNKKKSKECMNVMKCRVSKCRKQLENYINNFPKLEENLKCVKIKSNKGFRKCSDDLRKKYSTDENSALVNTCIATNCPEEYEFGTKLLKEDMETKIKTPTDECREKHCKKVSDIIKKKQLKVSENLRECHLKNKTHKEQMKCMMKYSPKPSEFKKHYDCMTKHCYNKPSKNTKNNKTSKLTKKN